MKYLLFIISLSLFTPSLYAEEAIEAELIAMTVQKPLPRAVDKWELNLNEDEGTTLTFIASAPNIVTVYADSLKLHGWTLLEKNSFGRATSYTSFRLYNKFYQDDMSALKLDGTITIGIGAEEKEKVLTLKKGDDPIEFPGFKVQYPEDKVGIRVIGNRTMIKSIKVELDGKIQRRRGSRSSGDDITYYYNGMTEKSKITLTYFSKTQKKIVKIIK